VSLSLRSASESVIFAALRNGDVRRAIDLLLQTYQDEVYGYCARLVGNTDAGAVYQRVLVVAIDDLPNLIGDMSVRAWIFGIARSAVTYHHRRARRGHPQLLDPDYIPVTGPSDATTRPGNVRHGAGRTARDGRVKDALGQLDPSMQEVLQLTLWHGLRLTEVAHVTGRSLAAVRTLAAHGLSQIALVLNRPEAPPS